MTLAPVIRSGPSLQVNGAKWTGSGLNCYWLGLDDNAGTPTGSFPSHATITAAFDGMQAMGANLVRAHTVGISAGTAKSYLTGYSGTTPTYVEANLDSADWAVYQAGLHGIRLMVPLTDNWNYYHGGLWNFVHWAYQQNPAGFPGDVNEGFTGGAGKDDQNQREFFRNTAAGLRARALFKDYISHWAGHLNPYTGLTYGLDPTIAFVETGNEIYYAAQVGSNEWTQDIASHIKANTSGKLVIDGSGASGQAVSTMPGLTAAAVDGVTAHYYPQRASAGYTSQTFNSTDSSFPAGSARQQLAADSAAALAASKAFILGEFPWTRPDVADFLADIEASTAIDGDMAWSFIAGTEVHGGSFGGDDFPIHWPYASGQEATYAPALAAHIRARATRPFPPMPVGDLPGGWKQVSAVDFATIPDFPMGTLVTSAGSKIISTDAASLALRDKIRLYTAGTPDTQVGGVSAGAYDPGRISLVNGVLRINMAVVNGVPTGAHFHLVPAGQETIDHWRLETPGMRYAIALRITSTDPHWGGVAFGIATTNAEDDWPEGGGYSGEIRANIHNIPSGFDPIGPVAGKSLNDWHRYESIRVPVSDPAPRVTYLIDDGVQVFTTTNAAKIGNDTMSVHYQAATDGTAPAAGSTSTVEIAWMVQYEYHPTATGTVQVSKVAVATPTNSGTVQVSRVRVASAGLPSVVQVSRVGVTAVPSVSVVATIEPYAAVTLPGSGWTQTAGPTTAPGAPAPAGPDGYTLRYTGPGEAVITVLPHTLFFDAAATKPAYIAN